MIFESVSVHFRPDPVMAKSLVHSGIKCPIHWEGFKQGLEVGHDVRPGPSWSGCSCPAFSGTKDIALNKCF